MASSAQNSELTDVSQPRVQLLLETTGNEDWAQAYKGAKDFCTEIPLPCSFLTTLKAEVENTDLVHLIIEVESEHPYKKRDEVTNLLHVRIDQKPSSTPGECPAFQQPDGLGLSQEFVPSLICESACSLISYCIGCVPALPVPKHPHQNSNPPNEPQDRQIKRPWLELLQGSETVYRSIPEPVGRAQLSTS